MLAVLILSMFASSPVTAGAKTTSPTARTAARARADEFGAPRAQDGARGFGYGRTRRDVERLLRSNAPEDRAFLGGLRDLAHDVELELGAIDARYRECGWYATLEPGEAHPEALGRRFRELSTDVPRVLRSGGAPADLLARLLTDQRFRTRSRVIDGVGSELADVRGALDLFAAQTDGWVDLTDAEIGALCERCDLAAARLRAIRLDLQALRDLPCALGANAPWQVDHERILMITRTHQHEHIERELAPILDRLDDAEDAMARPLFTTAFADRFEDDLGARTTALARAGELLPSARELDPDRAPSTAVSKSVAALGKSERRQRAARIASQAAAFDPLSEEAIWIAATTSDAAYGRFEARRWFDRYLALHGIRAYDDRTYRGRELTAEEERALDALHEADRLLH
ncbi:MAG: hypothetical protein HZA53_11520 [Planctomycetes bacterium]|nr:hypothetical protein [Planctomycetota bacterium]